MWNRVFLATASISTAAMTYVMPSATGRTEVNTYGGILVSIGDIGLRDEADAVNYLENTHGGMVEVNGQWYVFYHRQTNRRQYACQCCAEPVQVLPDGSIPQAEGHQLRTERRCHAGPGQLSCPHRLKPILSAWRLLLYKARGDRAGASLLQVTGRGMATNTSPICKTAHGPGSNTLRLPERKRLSPPPYAVAETVFCT